MKTIGLCGIGNAIVDLLLEVEEDEFVSLGLKRSGMQLVDVATQAILLKRVQATREEVLFKSGGSVANSVIAYAQLGGKSAFVGSIADDLMGREYQRDMEDIGVVCSFTINKGESTGTSLILITPDAERTMNTCLGCAGDFGGGALNLEIIQNSRWLLLEGYLLANPGGRGDAAINSVLECAVSNNTLLALTCSDAWVVANFFDKIKFIIPKLELLVANELEAVELSNLWVKNDPQYLSEFGEVTSVDVAVQILRRLVPECVITLGSRGALVARGSELVEVSAFKCEAVDLTGAGDAFLGTYINARDDGHSLKDAASMACFVASKVVMQLGPRLQDPGWLVNQWRGATSNVSDTLFR